MLGSKYYRYTNRTLDPGFPRRLKKGFSGVPPYLDAAILSGSETRINFIKNSFSCVIGFDFLSGINRDQALGFSKLGFLSLLE